MSAWRVLNAGVSLVAFLIALLGCSKSGAKLQTIYDQDSRRSLSDSDPVLAAYADSVALLTRSFRLRKENDQIVKITSPQFGDFFGLCPDEKFIDESMIGDCSGFLVTDSLLVTAGHCIASQTECEQRRFIFNHSGTQNSFRASDIYSCGRIVSSLPKEVGDLVLVELDRPRQRNPNSRRFSIEAIDNRKTTELTTLGHPSGLPLKSAPFEGHTEVGNDIYFFARADVSGGSSGSPLFEPGTGTVEGVLVGGENDFIWDSASSCSRNRICNDLSCRGERFATRAALLRLFSK